MHHSLHPILALFLLTCTLFSAAPQHDWHIVLPSQATSVEQTAAQELKHFLERCYPERFPITKNRLPATHAIYLGQSSQISKLLGNLDFTTLKPDEIILKTVGNNLVLTGHATRGTLYAVYEFLEQACGVRFWTPADTLCPRHESFSLPKLDFRYAPVFTDRKINCEVQRFPQFSARMRINHDTYMRRYPPLTEAWGGCNRILGWVHSIRELMPVKRYGASHPEFYALMESGKRDLSYEAQLCMSNPTMRKTLIQNMLNSLKKHPGTRVISLSQADSNRFCTCSACRDFIARHGNLSDLLMDLVNQAASAIQRIHPDVKVETLAYQFTRQPPKSIRPAPNVIIRLCSIECDFSEPLNAPDNQTFLKDLKGWHAFGNELYIWNYITNFTDFYRPQPNLYHLNLDLKLFAQNGVTSVMEQGFTRQGTGPETLGYADFQDLRTYLTCKLMWNPNLNPQAIIDEFLAGVYGPSAPFLKTYLDIIHKAPRKHPEAFVSCYSTSTNQWLETNDLIKAWQVMEQAIQTARNQQLHKLHRRLQILGLSINLTLLERKDLWHPQRHRLLDGIDWLKRLDGQLELAKANGIYQLSEHGGNLEALRRTMIRNHEPFNGGPKEPPELKGRAWKPLPATDAKIFGENHYAFVRPDAAAAESRAVMMKTVKHTWWVQLSKLPEGDYDIYAQVRCEGNAPNGDAVLLGIINNASQDPQRKPHITVTVPATSIAGKDYKLIRIGRTDVKSYFCLYAAPMVNPTLDAVWIDRFILVENKD